MIEILPQTIKNIPILMVQPQASSKNVLPAVFVYHGWTHQKESELMLAYFLADKGFRVILPDAKLHGMRHDDRAFNELLFEFWPGVMQSTDEFELLVDDLVAANLIDRTKIGVTGVSMGGITTAMIMKQYDFVKVGVDNIGSPMPVAFAKWQISKLPPEIVAQQQAAIKKVLADLNEYDLSLHLNCLKQRPMHFYHGTNDDMVPYQFTKQFINNNITAKNLTLTTQENGLHKVSDAAYFKTVALMQKYLMA